MTDRPDAGLISIEDALGKAVSEMEGVADDAAYIPDPEGSEAVASELPATEDAEPVAGEQPADGQESVEGADDTDIFADLDDETAGTEPDVFAELAAIVATDDTPAPKDLDELKEVVQNQKDGILRQADYTRKTQALAEERKAFESDSENALKLFAELGRDPAATVAYLAEQTGLVEKGALNERAAQVQAEWVPPLTGQEQEAEIEKRVEARLAEHPDVLSAQEATSLARVNQDFADIETAHGVNLTDKDKLRILKEAKESGTSNLGLIYDALQARVAAKRQAREQARAAASSRPGTRSDTSADKPAEVNTVADAFDLAIAEAEAAA